MSGPLSGSQSFFWRMEEPLPCALRWLKQVEQLRVTLTGQECLILTQREVYLEQSENRPERPLNRSFMIHSLVFVIIS